MKENETAEARRSENGIKTKRKKKEENGIRFVNLGQFEKINYLSIYGIN